MADAGTTGKSPTSYWLTKHADVVAAATDPESFSSDTSRFLHVPNTMDGEEHRAYRAIVDSYLTDDIVASLEPMFTQVAGRLVAELPRGETLDVVTRFGGPFAVRGQCRWLGWPEELEDRLLGWIDENDAAAGAGNAERKGAVAEAFDAIVREQVDARLAARAEDPGRRPHDPTEHLILETVHGRRITTEEIVSILRNWTAGDLGSLARCLGVVIRRLADEPDLQHRMRDLAANGGASRNGQYREEFDAIIDECLRIEDPFVSNRRVTTCPVSLPSGERVPGHARVNLDWTAANRDPEVFDPPDVMNPEQNRPHNLVYGIGPHACPGRELSTTELRAALTGLLQGTNLLRSAPGEEPLPQGPPLAGWSRVPVILS